MVNRKVKVEEVIRNVNIVAKNMGRITGRINARIKIKGKQFVTENQVSRISRIRRTNAAICSQQCVQMNSFPSPRECAELCGSKG
jgi:hypothetical protein